MTDREKFEAWAITQWFAIHRNGGEQYVNTATQHAWTGWQACALAAPSQPEGAEPVAWQGRQFYAELDDQGWGRWREVSLYDLSHFKGKCERAPDRFQLRPLYLQPSESAGAAAPDEGSGWISVDNRLPEPETPLLYYFEQVGVHAGRMGAGATCGADALFYGQGGFLQGDVTHWMPLPSAPKGEEGKP